MILLKKSIQAVLLSSFILLPSVASEPISVTSNNYVEAAVDISFASISTESGVNKFRHDRSVIPLDKQPAVTMNRDTVYSFGIFHVPNGTTITLPKSKDNRYQSAMILQSDHHIDQVFYAPGTFEIKSHTEFAAIVVRTQIDASSKEDGKYVNALQDKIKITAAQGVTLKEYSPRHWDSKSLSVLQEAYQKEAAKLPNLNKTSGAKGTIDPALQKLGVSVALGLLPPEHAVYIYRDFGLKKDECYKAKYSTPEFKKGGFFSFTMYGDDKYIKSEDSNLNNKTLKYDADGTFTIYYGPKNKCGDVRNHLNTPSDNWYLGMRIYRPVESIVNGEYKMPIPSKVN